MGGKLPDGENLNKRGRLLIKGHGSWPYLLTKHCVKVQYTQIYEFYAVYGGSGP
jgi:hypothetical protein